MIQAARPTLRKGRSMLTTEEPMAGTDAALDPHRLEAIRQHAAWVCDLAETTSPYQGRLLSRGELASWRDALADLLDETDRLRTDHG
jgi:hypothetical protein